MGDSSVVDESKLRRSSLVPLLFVVVVAAGSVGLFGPGRAAAQNGQLVGDAQAVTLQPGFQSPPGVRQMLPLAGLAFVAPSISAGFYGQVDSADGSYAPATPGDQLLYLSVDAYSFAPPFGQTGYHYASPQLSVTFAGHAVSLPETPDGSVQGVAGSQYGDDGAYYPGAWIVAVPKGVAVNLVATEAGFSQTLDLRTGSRVGPAPSVLYRSAAGPLALDLRPNLSGTLTVTAGGSRVNFPVTLTEATLNYFNLDSPNATSGLTPDEAYLFAEVSFGAGVDQQGRADWYFDPSVPTQAITLQSAGQSALTPAEGPAPPDPTDTGTLFKGVFGFVVPAGLTSASVAVSPGSATSVYFQGPDDLSPTAETVTSAVPASFSLTFPPPAPATVPSTNAITPSTVQSGAARQPAVEQGATTAVRHSSGDGSWTGVAAGSGAGLVVVIIGGVFISRRTRLVEPRPVSTDPSELPPGALEDPSAISDQADADIGGAPGDISGVPGIPTPGWPAGTQTGLKELPAAAPTERLPRLRVHLIGPLEVEGTTGVIRRRAVLRSLLVLAINLGRPLSGEELRYAMAESEDQEPSAPSLRSELSRLRGVLPPDLFPEHEPGSGYSLVAEEVQVDWVDFVRLAERAESCAGEERLDLALRALRLVRGPVLVHRSWHGIDSQVWEMNARIEQLAVDTASEVLEAGLPALAAEASRLGLAAVEGSPRLWRLRIDAAETGSGENVEQVKAHARAKLGDLPPERPA